jgi:hypothetical protein
VNEIEKWNADPAIAFRVADDEAEIALDEPAKGVLVALLLDAATEFAFFLDRQARQLGYGAKVRLKSVGTRRGVGRSPHQWMITDRGLTGQRVNGSADQDQWRWSDRSAEERRRFAG